MMSRLWSLLLLVFIFEAALRGALAEQEPKKKIAPEPQCMIHPRTFNFEAAYRRALAEQARLQAAEERRREQLKRQEELRQQQEARNEEEKRKKEERKQQQNPPTEPKKMEECPYQILGVSRDASRADIKKAYRKLSLLYHPDKSSGDANATDKFTKLVDAYEILGDEDRRAMHDDQTFGAYQSRPRNFNSKAGFYNGTSSLVTSLNQTEFDRLVLCKGPLEDEEECVPWMVKLYAPWCVHCKNLIPDWKRAAFTMDGIDTLLGFVRFGAVNCEAERKLCTSQGVRSFPGVHLYARDASGQEHMEKFPTGKPRNVENLIEHAEKSIRLAAESNLQEIDSFVMQKNVTSSESTGLWIVLFENHSCPQCGVFKAQLRRMSANLGKLANFAVFHCGKNGGSRICQEQYVGNKYPVLKLYPYKGSKGTGETLVKPDEDPLVVLPITEKVIRMCIANIETENGLMKPLHEDFEEEEPPPPPQPEYEYPQPERVFHRVSGAGIKAVGGARAQFIAGG